MNALLEQVVAAVNDLRQRVSALESKEIKLLSSPTIRGHLLAAGSTPSVAANTGLGTGGTVQLLTGSTDLVGTIKLTAGSSGLSNNLFVLTFAQTQGAANPFVFLTQGQSADKYLQAQATAEGPTSFQVWVWTLPTAGQTYYLNYLVVAH